MSNENKMKLWIDDERASPEGWEHAKTAAEAIYWLEKADITHISFDHDLGEDSKDGHQVMVVFEQRLADGLMNVPKMDVHSANPVGAARMRLAIDSINRRFRGVTESGLR